MALMLLDTYGLVYRAFFALPGLTTSKGAPINAVYGFTMMLNKLIADEKPTTSSQRSRVKPKKRANKRSSSPVISTFSKSSTSGRPC